MTSLIAPSAYVDFTSKRSLEDIGAELSRRLFAGVPFVGLGEGIWDEVPAMRLAERFMGLQVELGGHAGDDGGYTLQVEVPDFPWHLVGRGQANARVDLTGFLQHLLTDFEEISLPTSPASG